jgi:hypothetical protein
MNVSKEQLQDAIVFLLGPTPRRVKRPALRIMLGRYMGIEASDREIRLAYADMDVCSSEDGIYIPRTTEDLLEFKSFLQKRATALTQRWVRVLRAYPNLIPSDKQVGLDFQETEYGDRFVIEHCGGSEKRV